MEHRMQKGIMRIVPVVMAACVLCATADLLPSAAAKIYWVNTGLEGGALIWRANVNGSGHEALYETEGTLNGLALDPTNHKLYWGQSDRVLRSNLDGSNVETIVGGLNPVRRVVVDEIAGKLYWLENFPDVIRRANLDGSDVETIIADQGDLGASLAVDGSAGKLYWATGFPGSIWRSNLDGSAIEQLPIAGLVSPFSLAIDSVAEKIYWGEPTFDVIQRASLDGSGVETVVSDVKARAIVLDRHTGNLFWADVLPEPWGAVSVADNDGTDVHPIIEFPYADHPNAVALDGAGDVPATSIVGQLLILFSLLGISSFVLLRRRAGIFIPGRSAASGAVRRPTLSGYPDPDRPNQKR